MSDLSAPRTPFPNQASQPILSAPPKSSNKHPFLRSPNGLISSKASLGLRRLLSTEAVEALSSDMRKMRFTTPQPSSPNTSHSNSRSPPKLTASHMIYLAQP